MKTQSTEIERHAEEAARNRVRLSRYYQRGHAVHPAHRHLINATAMAQKQTSARQL